MKTTLLILGLTTFASTAQAAPCDDYVDCVCDWSKELGKKAGDTTSAAQCNQIKQMYKGAGSTMQSACKDALKIFKDTMKQQAAAYSSMGVSIPSSCK